MRIPSNPRRRPRLSFANVTALIALFVALGGSAYAVTKDEIRSRHIADGAVKSKDLRDDNVKSKDIKDGHVGNQDIADGAVDRKKIAPGSVGFDEIEPDAVTTEHLEARSVSGNEVAEGTLGREHLVIKCGPDRTNVDGLCFDSVNYPAAEFFFFAQFECERNGGRLPTPLQARGVRNDVDFGDRPIWTDSIWFDDTGLRSAVAHDNGGISAAEQDASYNIICVYEPLA